MWRKTTEYNITGTPNVGQYMSSSRFKQIKRFYVDALKDPSGNGDMLWPIQYHVDEFNKNRVENVAASIYKTDDEAMSSFRPQKEKTGKIPHLSHIARKPKPIGTEFKATACAKSKIMLHIEIQRGKEGMKNTKYHKELGATAACTLRLAEATNGCGRTEQEQKRDIHICDSWFGSF